MHIEPQCARVAQEIFVIVTIMSGILNVVVAIHVKKRRGCSFEMIDVSALACVEIVCIDKETVRQISRKILKVTEFCATVQIEYCKQILADISKWFSKF